MASPSLLTALKMFIVGAGSDSVYQYTLSTAWDISTAVHHSISFSVNSEDTFPSGVTFSTDGLKMFIMGNSTDSVYQYSLTTAWDISDVTYNSVSLDITSQDTFPHGVTFSSDGTKMFVIGSSSDSVHAYNIPLSAGITSDDIIISDDYRTSTDGVSVTIDTTHTDRTSLSFRVRNPTGDWSDSVDLADSSSQSFDLSIPKRGRHRRNVAHRNNRRHARNCRYTRFMGFRHNYHQCYRDHHIWLSVHLR